MGRPRKTDVGDLVGVWVCTRPGRQGVAPRWKCITCGHEHKNLCRKDAALHDCASCTRRVCAVCGGVRESTHRRLCLGCELSELAGKTNKARGIPRRDEGGTMPTSADWADAGICYQCHSAPCLDGLRRCAGCAPWAATKRGCDNCGGRLAGMQRRWCCIGCARAGEGGRRADRRRANRDRGLCGCGVPPLAGRAMCRDCDEASRRSGAAKAARVRQGECWNCRARAAYGSTYCEAHYIHRHGGIAPWVAGWNLVRSGILRAIDKREGK